MHTHLLCFLSLAGKDFGRNRDGFIHFFFYQHPFILY